VGVGFGGVVCGGRGVDAVELADLGPGPGGCWGVVLDITVWLCDIQATDAG
jgi:hypothetical protein